MHSAGYAVARCLSVRLSVRRWYCVDMAVHIIKLFHRRGTVLVFLYQSVWQYSDGDPLNGGRQMQGV